MPASKNNFFDHVRLFRSACQAVGADAIVGLENMEAFVRKDGRHVVFYPQFQATRDGRIQYQHVLTEDAWMFAGWLPYRLKRWDIALDKLAFKRYAASVDMAVPRHWLSDDEQPENVVVKSPVSSFGLQVDGPFRSATERKLDLTRGEYYEEFVEGRLLKAWFWNDRPVCAELDAMPRVRGDGVATAGDLIMRRAAQFGAMPAGKERERLLARCGAVLRYHGLSLGHVPPRGKELMVEFRYGSNLMHPAERTVLDLRAGAEPAWLPQLQDAGPKMYAAIPASIRPATMYTLDAILAADGRLRFLEVNCNPTVHPLVYPAAAADILEPAAAAEAVH